MPRLVLPHLLAPWPAPLLALLLALGCTQAAAQTQDLLQVYALARAADPVLASVRSQRDAQQEAVQQARAAWLPQASATATANHADRSDGNRSQQLGLSLSQTLYDQAARRSWDAASTDALARDASLAAAEQDLRARTARAYFGVLTAQAALANALANEEAFALQVAQASSRLAARLSAAVDVEQARAYHALSTGNTLQAQQTLADARQALAQITGQLPGDLLPLGPALPAQPPQPADAQHWVDQALATNPQLQAQTLGLAATEQRIDVARAAHQPTLALTLDSNRNPGVGSAGRYDTLLALRLKVPLFAGGATQSQVRQAAHQRDAARQDLEAARRALLRETQAQFQAVRTGARLMHSTRVAVVAAEAALASTRAGQALGTRGMTDLLLAIQTHTAALSAHDEARHAYVLARLALAQAAGVLDDSQLATVNHWLQGAP